MTNLLEMRNITKTFLGGKIIANQNVSFTVRTGEVHALVGENGSGKTTLMNILFGLYKQDSGEILINGNKVEMYSPKASKSNQIGMVHQHFNLIDKFSVLDNILIGQEENVTSKKWFFGGIISKQKAYAHFDQISKNYEINLNPDEYVGNLSVGQKQMVEIMKVLWQEKQLIVFDEPTATLSVDEIKHLLNTIDSLKNDGVSIVFISHKLKEVKQIADRVTILNKGLLKGTYDNDKYLTIEEIAILMVGKDIKIKYPERPWVSNNVILDVRNLSYVNKYGNTLLDNVSFDVKEGEIFGLAGIEGNGQEEVLLALVNLIKASGNVTFFKRELNTVKELDFSSLDTHIINNYISHIPSDRFKYGMILNKSLEFNSFITSLNDKKFSKLRMVTFDKKSKRSNNSNLIIDRSGVKKHTNAIIDLLNVEGTGSTQAPIKNLSGGNQQKFVVGREIIKNHKILLAGHPTRGLDLKAIDNVYRNMIKDSKNKGTILYSLEISELLGVCDRVAIFHNGSIVDIINPRDIKDVSRVPKLMVGG